MKGEIIYEYGKNPVNWGEITHQNFSHKEKNISCGEEIEVYFLLTAEGIITEIGFVAEGRLITIAAMSLLAEEIEGKNIQSIEDIHHPDVLEMLEVDVLSPRRLKSALLGLLTLKNAYRTRQNLPLLDFGDLIEES